MSTEVLIPLISGLVGALVGALSSIVTLWLQLKSQAKRDRLKLASEMARDEHEYHYKIARDKPGNYYLAPVVTYQQFHYRVLEALESGTLGKKEIERIKLENKKLTKAIKELDANS